MPPQNPSSVQSPGAYIPPHLNSNHPSSAARNGTSETTRYSKEQMFAIFQSQRDSNDLTRHVPQVVEDTWLQVAQDHSAVPATPRGESADQYPGPGVCWKDQPEPLPWGLRTMDEEEKQVRSHQSSQNISNHSSSSRHPSIHLSRFPRPRRMLEALLRLEPERLPYPTITLE